MRSGEPAPDGHVARLRYGRGEISARLDQAFRVKVVAPPGSERPPDPVGLLARALEKPVASPALADLAPGKRRVVISIPDGTRPQVARHVLPDLVARLRASGVDLHTITIFVASGAHAGSSEDQLRELAGEGVPREIAIHQNYARRAPDFRLVGITRRGTPVMLNNLLLEADLNVVVGSVAFHYFAGMTGGRKMIMPGACHVQTIVANHKLTLAEDGTLNPMCATGNLEGNPVHEDMLEGAAYLRNVFMVNAVLDGWGDIREITCGEPVRSHLEATRLAKQLLEVPVGERCDLAIAGAGGHPMDVDFIQTHKSIDHAAEAVRDGGALVIAAECSAGVGSETFLPWFSMGGARAVSRRLRAQYQLNAQTALALMKKLERIRVFMVTRLERATVESMGIAFAATLEEAVEAARANLGPSPLTYVLPIAWGIVPFVEA
ncbi:MAG TPA: nickel-dependent lactate racemase [bacterium]|nr:nickel-dependent lactate racemase [bacterium]